MLRSEQQLRQDIFETALVYAQTEETCHLETLKALVAIWDKRVSVNCVVTTHAVKQFMNRSRCTDESTAIGSLKAMLAEAEQMELKEQYIAIQLLNHDYKEAQYYKYHQWLLVVIGNAIITCHNASAKRWRKASESRSDKREIVSK